MGYFKKLHHPDLTDKEFLKNLNASTQLSGGLLGMKLNKFEIIYTNERD